jgi:hypothetical protein
MPGAALMKRKIRPIRTHSRHGHHPPLGQMARPPTVRRWSAPVTAPGGADSRGRPPAGGANCVGLRASSGVTKPSQGATMGANAGGVGRQIPGAGAWVNRMGALRPSLARSLITVDEGGDSNLVPCSAQHRKARAIAVSAAIAARHTFADALGCHRHQTSGAWTARAAPGDLDDRSLTASVRERTGVVRRPAMVQLLELSEADAANRRVDLAGCCPWLSTADSGSWMVRGPGAARVATG